METTKFHTKLRNLCIIAHKIYVWIFATFVTVVAAYFFTTLGKIHLTNVKKNQSDQSTICLVPYCIITTVLHMYNMYVCFVLPSSHFLIDHNRLQYG